MADSPQMISSEADALDTLTGAEIWLSKIRAARGEELLKDWRTEAMEALEIYENRNRAAGSLNIFHSNVEVQSTALYNSTPISDVRRRHGDKDPVAKLVSETIERATSYSVDQYDFDDTMRAALRQSLVVGRGTARIMYEPIIGKEQDPQTGEEYEAVTSKEVKCRIVPWDRWGHGPGRSWDEVNWIYFEHALTEQEVKGLIGEVEDAAEKLAEVSFGDVKRHEHEERQDDDHERGILKVARVYEIWDKASQSVLFIAEDNDQPLTTKPAEMELPGFFPIPRPLQFKARVDSLVPLVPLSVYRDLVRELDKINGRISALLSALKVRGFIDPKMSSAFQELSLLEDGEYAIADAAESRSLITGGGIKLDDFVSHWPLEPMILALRELYVNREAVKALIYEATGISDIIRGSVDPREKLGQSEIKAQAGSMRLEEAKNEVSRYARDLYRLIADVICAQFEDQDLRAITLLPQTQEDEQHWPAALKIIKDDRLRGYKVDIETNSTLRADTQATQEIMSTFLGATAQFGEAAVAIGQHAPPVVPALISTYLAFTRKMPLGKRAEDALEALEEMAPKLQGMQKAQQDEQRNFERENRDTEMKSRLDIEAVKANAKLKELKVQQANQPQEQPEQPSPADEQRAALEREKHARDMEMKEQAHRIALEKMEREHAAAMEMKELEYQIREREAERKEEQTEFEFDTKKKSAAIDMKKSIREKGLSEGKDGEATDPIADSIKAMVETVSAMVEANTKPRKLNVTRDKAGNLIGATVEAT